MMCSMLTNMHRQLARLTRCMPVHAPASPETHLLQIGLSPREAQVALSMARGLTVREISDELGIAKSSSATYCKRVYAKLGVSNMGEARAYLNIIIPHHFIAVDRAEYGCQRLVLPEGLRDVILGGAVGIMLFSISLHIEEIIGCDFAAGFLPMAYCLIPFSVILATAFALLLNGRQTAWRNEAAFITGCLVLFVIGDLVGKSGGQSSLAKVYCPIFQSGLLDALAAFILLVMIGLLLMATDEMSENAARRICSSMIVMVVILNVASAAVRAVSLYPWAYLIVAILGVGYLRSCALSLPRVEYRRAPSILGSSFFAIACLGLAVKIMIEAAGFRVQETKGAGLRILMAVLLLVIVVATYGTKAVSIRELRKPSIRVVAEMFIAFSFGVTIEECFNHEIVQWDVLSIISALMLAVSASLILARRIFKVMRFADGDELAKAVTVLADHDVKITPAELGVFQALVEGEKTSVACNELCISRDTFNSHVRCIYRKLGVHASGELRGKVETLVRESKRLSI